MRFRGSATLTILSSLFLLAVPSTGQIASATGAKYRVLHRFTDSPDGAEPRAALLLDATGNLYGTTYRGGVEGTVFELTQDAKEHWLEVVLYDFSAALGGGGGFPTGSVIRDESGNLYGTASPSNGNNGVAFELTPNVSALWSENVIHAFNGNDDGANPFSAPSFDQAGNLYGTTAGGGALLTKCGAVYELVPSGGSWQESILHAFTCQRDGNFPSAPLVLDKSGILYGTTQEGGSGCGISGCGTVFKLAPVNGIWIKTTIYSFRGGTDGSVPTSALVFDKAGNLYGTTALGGVGICVIENVAGCGTVFRLTPLPKGEWKKTAIYTPDGNRGGGLFGGIVFDRAGNLYGSASFYGVVGQGCAAGCGSVFKLSPGSGNVWTETTMHLFKGGADGGEPYGSVILNEAGHIFGTAAFGGDFVGKCQTLGCGLVFEIIP